MAAYKNNVVDLTPSNTTDPHAGRPGTEGPYDENVVDLTPSNTTDPHAGHPGTEGPYDKNVVDLTPNNTTDPTATGGSEADPGNVRFSGSHLNVHRRHRHNNGKTSAIASSSTHET